MSKANITLIVVLMTLASFGLMGFQYYWVKNAISINQERFDQNVYTALSRTIETLEKGEASGMILNTLMEDTALQDSLFEPIDPIELSFRQRQVISNRASVMDSLELSLAPQVSPTFRRLLQSRGVDLRVLDELQDFFTYMTPEVASGIFTPDEMAILLQEKEKQLNYLSDLEKRARENPQALPSQPELISEINISSDAFDKIRKANMKINFLNVAYEEMTAGQKNIMERIDPEEVAQVFYKELSERGIQEEFELGVINNEGKVFALSTVTDTASLINNGVQAKLFPSDIIGRDNFLSVYFPEKDYHVLQQVWLPIGSSVLFIGVIIFCFVYAIRVILHQKALSQIKNDFINNMTHEFKTPLATVSLAVEALQDPELSSKSKFRDRYLGVIKDENKRLVAQVENVLQAAALDKKDFKLKIEVVNIPDLIEESLQHVSLQIEQKHGTSVFHNKLSEPWIEADLYHLTHIFNNMLDNAIKYSPEKLDIQITAKDDGNIITLIFSDQGIGMSKDAQRKIFDKFYRVHTGNVHDVKGFGLGLSYVKTMVEAHHGTISVQSDVGKGSTFTINLPKKQ
ncbi:sensor histidine kinase [Algoriphagus namhaensis]|uniref:histidine kinase n=1 Tax=Algoriphagus namhaensis TaxID=915353 RepID=A0ABV8ASA2_9BACT